MEDTKVIYHIDDEETPYLVKIPVVPTSVTLGDFKNALNRPNYKFFFKSMDADFGVVKEEITDDDTRLPCFNGKVISWLVSADSSTKSDNPSASGDAPLANHVHSSKVPNSSAKTSSDGVTPSNRPAEPPSEQEQAVGTTGHGLEDCDTCAETDSVYSGDRVPPLRSFPAYKHGLRLAKHGQRPQAYETSSSMMSSDLESTSFFDSEDESSRFSTATGTTMSSAKYARHQRRPRNRGRRILPVRRTSEDASSFSSMTDSTMSLNVITVTLNMDTVNFLGISIVGQSNKAGDGGIYVGSIMRGGAVAQDGRIEPGDMILEVNRISFEDMSNDEAVRILREEVQKPGPITLVVAKCWDPTPKDYFTIPRQEPVRPIDPRAWVLHTNAMTGAHLNAHHPNAPGCAPFGGPNSPPGMNMMPGGFLPLGPNPAMPPSLLSPALTGLSTATTGCKSLPEATADPMDPHHHHHHHHLAMLFNDTRGYRSGGPSSGAGAATASTKTRSINDVDQKNASLLAAAVARSMTSLSLSTDMVSVVRTILSPDSGLDVRDRTWLKITIPNAFIGSDLVDWLYNHVDGFTDRKEARRYASEMLKCGYIRHTVNKTTFSEQCYYTFGDSATALAELTFDEIDSVSEVAGPAGSRTSNTTTTSHSSIPQCYPHLHHPAMPDTNNSGMTAGLLPPGSHPGSGGLQSNAGNPAVASLQPGGPHYPYPQMLYTGAGSPPNFANGSTVPSSMFLPVSSMAGQTMRPNNGHCPETNPQLTSCLPHSDASHTFTTTTTRNPAAAATSSSAPHCMRGGAANSSSSSSTGSHCSPSSGSSSSSASSGTGGRRGRKPRHAPNPPPSSSNGSGPAVAGTSPATGLGSTSKMLSHEQPAQTMLATFVRSPGVAVAAPSVHSVSASESARPCGCLRLSRKVVAPGSPSKNGRRRSLDPALSSQNGADLEQRPDGGSPSSKPIGTSSASSVSRQNGTGASATGSGSGSARTTGRVTARPSAPPPTSCSTFITTSTTRQPTPDAGPPDQRTRAAAGDTVTKSSGGSSTDLPTGKPSSAIPTTGPSVLLSLRPPANGGRNGEPTGTHW